MFAPTSIPKPPKCFNRDHANGFLGSGTTEMLYAIKLKRNTMESFSPLPSSRAKGWQDGMAVYLHLWLLHPGTHKKSLISGQGMAHATAPHCP